MSLFSKQNFVKRRPMSSLLGLALDGNHLEGAVVLQHNGALKLAQAFTATLALDPLTNEPELVGREILNHLESAGIRERCCVVAVPLKWALTTQTGIPPLPEADVAGFLQIEAEKGFPCDAATLRVAASRSTVPPGQDQATLVGIPAGHLERLEQALRAARLKPLSFVPGITALQPPSDERSQGVLALVLGEEEGEVGGGVGNQFSVLLFKVVESPEIGDCLRNDYRLAWPIVAYTPRPRRRRRQPSANLLSLLAHPATSCSGVGLSASCAE